jgi:hypothetical protein
MANTHNANREQGPASAEALFDGPLGSFLEVVVRFEERLSRALAPLARRAERVPALPVAAPVGRSFEAV